MEFLESIFSGTIFFETADFFKDMFGTKQHVLSEHLYWSRHQDRDLVQPPILLPLAQTMRHL